MAPLAQLAFAAATEQALALLCTAHTARAGLNGQQLPAGARVGAEGMTGRKMEVGRENHRKIIGKPQENGDLLGFI